MLTDLTREEAGSLFNNEEVSADNVIEMHEYLKNFKGEISEFI